MQFIAIALLAAASLTNAQSVPPSAPGCVKYCLRIAREQAPSACTWAGWCALSGFQDSVSNCYSNTCGTYNQQVGADIYQQICSQAGSDTTCPSGGASVSSAIASTSQSTSSVISSVASQTSSTVSSTSDVVTSIGGTVTSIPASATSSVASALSSSSAAASSSSESVALSVSSAMSTATAPVSSAISSLLSSAASVVASASSAASAGATQSSNAANALGLPSFGQVASLGAIFVGIAAGALML